jgi:cobyrinic acid a,c-diamide synthase
MIARLADAVSAGVDLDRIIDLASAAGLPAGKTGPVASPQQQTADVRIAIARDAAFGFYYPDDLEAFAAAGAELIAFDALNDAQLPDVDGLFIGGGFPETHLATLSANQSLLANIRQALASGMPAYAECGGLMYLARSIAWRGEKRNMVGAVPADVIVGDRPQGRGYVVLEETGRNPWPPSSAGQGAVTASIPAHEFHYARLENMPDDLSFAFRVVRGAGIDGHHDGIVIGNLLAGFAHHRNTGANPWVNLFVEFVRKKSGQM